MSSTAVFLLLLMQGPPASQSNGSATDPSKPQAQSTLAQETLDSDDLPVSIGRIQRALAAPPAIKLPEPTTRNGRQLYHVDIEGERIDMRTLLSREALRGPVPYGGMTHQEFLDLVTPEAVKGYAPYSNAQGITIAATSIALQWAVLKAIDSFRKAKDNHEQEAARQEVEQALEALKKARRAAGLPEK